MTAHRGFSGHYPENTLLAFSKAVELGVEIVEFDVRESSDGALVILHDALLDRTTEGSGPVNAFSLAELKCLNATYWRGPHDTGKRMPFPEGEERIPTLEEALALLAGKVGLNIQVYTDSRTSLEKILRLYLDYDLKASGFLMLKSFEEGEWIRAFSPDVAICIGEDRANLDRHLAFGVDYIQPTRDCLTDRYVQRLIESGLPANIFYANDPASISTLIGQRVPGIMSDRPDVLLTKTGCLTRGPS